MNSTDLISGRALSTMHAQRLASRKFLGRRLRDQVNPGHASPLILAANRDERLDRAWNPPAAGRVGALVCREILRSYDP